MPEKTAEELEAERLEAEKKKKKLEFSDEQTEFINKLFDRAWAESAAAKEKELKEKLDAERAERDKLAAEKAELEKKLAEAAKQPPPKQEEQQPPPVEIKLEEHPMFKQLKAQFEEMQGIFQGVKQERDALKQQNEKDRAERRKTRKKDHFLQALSKAEVTFFDPLEAYELAEKEGLEYDEESDRVIVKNSATGQPKLNANGEQMDAVDFVKDFAKRKKYLVKSLDPGGLGQHESEPVKEKPSQGKDWSRATPEELEAERQRILSQPRDR